MKRAAIIIIFYVLAGNALFAQLSKENYKKQANEVRNEVWGWNIKAFNNSVVPDSMKNFSYVVLARHQELVASSKKKINYYGLALAVSRELIFVRTFRERVKLQDKAALDQYSYINYTAYDGKRSGIIKKDVISVVGVKITKPDGTTKEVNTDEAVFTVDKKSNREAKLAIPDLEVGDVLDYFVQIYDRDKDISLPEPTLINLVLADEVPILHYSLHGLISKKFALEHTSINKAPHLKITDNDDDWEFNVGQDNIAARPVGLWLSTFRQLPIIRLNLLPAKSIGSSPRQKPGHLNDAITKEDLIEDISRDLRGHLDVPVANVKDMLKDYSKIHGKIPDDSIALYAYYAYRYICFYWSFIDDGLKPVDAVRNYPSNLNENLFAIRLSELFKKLNIDAELLLVTSKYGPSDKQVFAIGDFMFIVKTTSKPANMYFSLETMFSTPGEIPYQYERENTFNAVNKNRNSNSTQLPAESALQNKHLEYLRLSFDGNDFSRANVKRTTTLSGHFKADAQQQLLLFEDYYKEEQERFGQWNFMDELEKNRKTKALADEYKLAMRKARDGLKDVFTKEIASEFESKPSGSISGKVIQSGIRHDAPEMIYNTEFTLDNITKKAGNNYLLNIGALIGGQLDIKNEQRKRNDDIYMPYARSFIDVIEIEIPVGYKVEGLENINAKVDNATGWFGCKATMENNKLTLKIEKGYRKSFMKADEWPALLEMLDKAVALKDQKLLLKYQ